MTQWCPPNTGFTNVYPISGAIQDLAALEKDTQKLLTAQEEWQVTSTESPWESIFTGGLPSRYRFPFELLDSSCWQLPLLDSTLCFELHSYSKFISLLLLYSDRVFIRLSYHLILRESWDASPPSF